MRDLLSRAVDPDRAVIRAMSAMVDAAAARHALQLDGAWYEPGGSLKLFLAGYSGNRNTGGDVRVEEMIRQLRTILGDEHLELTLLTFDARLSAGYFRTARQVELPKRSFPKFLLDQCPRHHGVVACEGSMFKSKFANALTTMMTGALGIAAAEGKLSVGYGGEAGAMDEPLAEFVRRQCKNTLVICRNEASRRVLEGIGIRTTGGTDTAWTFEPAVPALGEKVLQERGWDGRQKLFIVCPINPFWWPAKPDLIKYAARALGGQFRAEHYDSVYFHSWSEQAGQRYERYIEQLAEAVSAFSAERDVFVALVGSEMLDRTACEDLAARLPRPVPLLVSDELPMYELVSVLRHASYLVSSRFHAIVTSMPAGVPAIGVTMDERIANLMRDRGHDEFLFDVEDEGLAESLLDALVRLEREEERIRHQTLAFVPGEIRKMGKMGIEFVDEVLRIYPEFPARDVPRSWEHFIPPLSPSLKRLLVEHA